MHTDAARYEYRCRLRGSIGYNELARWVMHAVSFPKSKHTDLGSTHALRICHRSIRPDAAQNTRRLSSARSILTDAARYAVRIGVVPPRFDIGYAELARWTATRRLSQSRNIPTSATHNATRTCHRDIPSDAAQNTRRLTRARSILTDAARYAVRIGVVPPRIDIGYTELARWTADARRQARGRHIPTSATHNATRCTCHRDIRPDAAQNTRRLTRARSILTDAARYAVRIGVVPPRFDIGYAELARWTANARRLSQSRNIPTSATHNATRRTCHRDIPSDAAQNTRRLTRARSILTDAARYAVRIGVVPPRFDIGYTELARWTADARRLSQSRHIPTSATHKATSRTCHRDIPSDAAQNTCRLTRARSILTDAARYAVRIGVVPPRFDIGYTELARWTANARRQARRRHIPTSAHTMQLVALVIEIYLPTPHKIHVV